MRKTHFQNNFLHRETAIFTSSKWDLCNFPRGGGETPSYLLFPLAWSTDRHSHEQLATWCLHQLARQRKPTPHRQRKGHYHPITHSVLSFSTHYHGKIIDTRMKNLQKDQPQTSRNLREPLQPYLLPQLSKKMNGFFGFLSSRRRNSSKWRMGLLNLTSNQTTWRVGWPFYPSLHENKWPSV